jgi:glycosyltransferase involved in cell wall biosynthesis
VKISVLTGRYPSKTSPYSHMFVHTRNKEYLAQGHEVVVLVPSNKPEQYVIEGVKVVLGDVFSLAKYLADTDRVMIHLLLHRLDKATDAGYLYDIVLKERLPTLFFIHGVESQTIWHSRREDIKWKDPKSIARWLYRDYYLLQRMIKTLASFNEESFPCRFVTPSKWMLEESMRHNKLDLTQKSLVIPNGIDTEHFKFEDRWANRFDLLSMRPLVYSGKYAVDLLLESASKVKLPKSLTQYGHVNGARSNEAKIRQVASEILTDIDYTLHANFVNYQDIPKIHKEYGLYMAVTRMDAQGVSMCEAMASGLPTVSFNTCAIPEFIEHRKTGLLAQKYCTSEFASYVDELVEDRQLFDAIASNARAAMEAIDVRKTTNLEVNTKL